MANLLEDIITFYKDQGLIAGLGIDAFVDTMPDKPTSCLAIYEYPGGPQPSYTDIATRSVQVCFRCANAEASRKFSLDLYNSIVPVAQRQDLTANRWALIEPNQTPFKLKIDTQGNYYYAFNLTVISQIDYN